MMTPKQEKHIIKGMQRDLSVSKFNPEFAYECKNIRVTARDNNTLLSVTNERGTKELVVKDTNGKEILLDGFFIGSNVLNKYVTIFLKRDKDYIYRLEDKDDFFEIKLLFAGDLNFSKDNPIESISVYENEDIQKVYFLDGRNQNRVINIAATDEVRVNWLNTSFDFVQKLKLEEHIRVERNDLSNGLFASGVIQYAFTYYNKYAQESNIFYVTPLQYISFNSRGASPEEKVSNNFSITIENVDYRFDYLRIYSIHRTSIDATPTVKNITDLAIDRTGMSRTLTYVDNGTTGVNVDPTELLYIGGEEVVFQTMTQKDNTLFLGNANIQRKLIGKDIIDKLKGGDIKYEQKVVDVAPPSRGFYPYKNSLHLGSDIKSFKYLDWNRFGIQFQHITGKWSEPIWINDAYNKDIKPSNEGLITVAQSSYNLPKEVIEEAVNLGFIKARGVLVYPTVHDREVVAQGMLCPTVYNVGDRFSNSPFAQASWFSRPNMAFDITKNYNNWDILPGGESKLDSKAAVIRNDNETVDGTYLDIIDKGAWAEFRHNYPIPDNLERNAEIQVLTGVPSTPFTRSVGAELISEVASKSEYFYVDQSILTFHSPDIEFDDNVKNIDSSNLKMRIVGVIPITGNASDIDVQVSTPQLYKEGGGFYKEFIGIENNSIHGLKSLCSMASWIDNLINDSDDKTDAKHLISSYMIYPWHRNGSLNNQSNTVEGARTAMLDKKKMSNLKFSSFTKYFNEPWNAYVEDDFYRTGITPVGIFDSKEKELLRLPAPKYSDLGDINYYGNIDKVVTVNRNERDYYLSYYFEDNSYTHLYNKKDGYPIISAGASFRFDDSTILDELKRKDSHRLYSGATYPLYVLNKFPIIGGFTKMYYGTDPVRIKYKSTPHAVFALNYTKAGRQNILPTTQETDFNTTWYVNKIRSSQSDIDGYEHFFWNSKAKKITDSSITIRDRVEQDILTEYMSTPKDNNYGYLFLAELYNDDIVNRFGGQTDEAFESNLWIPGGEPIAITKGLDQYGEYIPLDTNAKILYTEGDTFFSRYDCIKTYPFTLEDQNSITEIVSFMCETRVNLDGRYDKNRGQLSNLVMSPENFNKMNPVYNQKDSFFNYRGINYNFFNLDYFPNVVTWTKEKQLGSIIDIWTNITMASTLDLDGDKGEVVSLNTFNNNIYCFQRMGLSNILFNSRIQIPTSDGMPIEISNGMKVDGKRYVSNTVGCDNKWSIVESPLGLYFADNETNSIYLFNGELASLSDALGFRQWVSENLTSSKWTPEDYGNIKGFYDKGNDDVYFVGKDFCLCYSELVGQFTSFYDYNKVPTMFNIGSEFYSINKGRLWENFKGDYNMFYGEFKPYYVTIVANEEPNFDKLFTNLEFRADSWNEDNLEIGTAFTDLDVYNEYQHGNIKLVNKSRFPSTLKKKFRVWRANIPRANVGINGIPGNTRDRIRNTWAYVKLSSMERNTHRTELHDITVNYFM